MPTLAEIDKAVTAAAAYQSGQSLGPFRQIEDWVRESVGEPAWRNQIEGALIKLISPNASFEARRFACKQLGIMGSEAALPALGRLLDSDETAAIACLALTTYPRGPADEILRTALGSATAIARRQIVEILGDRRDPKSVKLLAVIAGSSDASMADAAISSLGKIGTSEAWKALAALRKMQPTSVALSQAMMNCADHLAKAGDRTLARTIFTAFLEPSEPAHIRRGAFIALVRLDKDGGEARILQTLSHPDPVLRPVAIAAVRNVPARISSQRFAEVLFNLTPEEQVWMIDSLAVRADAAAHEAIARSLTAGDPQVRRAGISALGRIGDASAVKLLARAAAESTGPEDLKSIESSLITLAGDGETDRAIVTELQHSPPNARVVLIGAIAPREGAAANPVILEETASSNAIVAKAAFLALTRTASASEVSALLSRLNSNLEPAVREEAQIAATAALGKIENAPQRSAVVRAAYTHATTDEGRISLLNLLPSCADSDSLALAKTALENSNAKIRSAALTALADWPDMAAWDTLVHVYGDPGSEPERTIALRGLVRLAGESNEHPDSELVGRYAQLLAGARGDADLKLILGGLSGVPRAEALQLALPLLSNSGVRAEAEVAVRKIAESIKSQSPEAAQAALQRLEAKQ